MFRSRFDMFSMKGVYIMSKKYVYLFSEGNAKMRELLGGKGANLAEMTNIGLPVPQGFTITTEACTQYYEDGGISDEIMAEIEANITKMEEITGKKFGDIKNPLLVSVRSGARASMSKLSPNSPATPAGPGTATEDSSRCIPMSSWKSARNISKNSSTR